MKLKKILLTEQPSCKQTVMTFLEAGELRWATCNFAQKKSYLYILAGLFKVAFEESFAGKWDVIMLKSEL